MKRFLSILTILLAFGFFKYSYSASACNIPPFLASSAPPNVLFVIDVSGSMGGRAYLSGYTGNEEGYFIPNVVYEYDFSAGYWKESSASTASSCPGNPFGIDINRRYMGSCLNYLLMSRIDLLRWAITGGRPAGCLDGNYTDPACDPDIACTGSHCILEARLRVRIYGFLFWLSNFVLVPKERVKGILQTMEEENVKPRFGAIFYSKDPKPYKIYIGDYPDIGSGPMDADPSYPYTYLKRMINALEPRGATGTAPAMWEAYDYFAQKNLHKYKNGFELSDKSNPDTYFMDPLYVCDHKGKNCAFAPCAKNFVILASDGQWNRGGAPGGGGGVGHACSIEVGYENYSADPVVPAYRMHKDILRTEVSLGNTYDISVDSVYALGLFLGGTGEHSLRNVAVYGSFDVDTYEWPFGTSGFPWNGAGAQYPWDTCEMDDCCSGDDCGRGSACTPLPPSSPDWDSDGDGVPDNFLNANNAVEIKESLLTFLRDILKKTSSGSSVSILSRRGTKGNSVLQAVFYPEKPFAGGYKVSWVGYLYNYWFYHATGAQEIREDTDMDRVLNTSNDYILDFEINSFGNLIVHGDDPTTATSPDVTYSSIDDVHEVWEAGELLKTRDPDTRKIYAVGQDGGVDRLFEFTVSNKTKFDQYMGDPANFPSCLQTSSDPYGDLIRFVRGEHIENCRDRRVDSSGNVWKLGDIIYSTPVIVDYGDYGMVFVGANDGMLHAFRIGALRTDGLSSGDVVKICDEATGSCVRSKLGQEEWAFIPKNALPYLSILADPNYTPANNEHIYIVDLQPYILRLDTDGDGIPEKAILIGGMGLGGGCGCTGRGCVNPPSDTCPSTTSPSNCVGLSSYFALDITDPQKPELLWEFTHPDLGFSDSGPAHITVDGKHFIMFVSGPTNLCGEVAQDLKIFILELTSTFELGPVYVIAGDTAPVSSSTGLSIIRDSTLNDFSRAFGGRLFTEGVDYNDDGNTDFVFFGVNKYDASAGEWKGNVLGVRITGDLPDKTGNSWYVVKLFPTDIDPVTAKVEYMKCFNMNYLFFGTGRWFFKEDEAGKDSSDVNKLYGIRIDDCLFNDNCSVNVLGAASDSCTELGKGTKIFGWYRELKPKDTEYSKERLISDPAASNYDVIFFATTQPTGNICGFGGRSRLWGLNCATGLGLFDSSCSVVQAEPPADLVVLLQLSRGNIEVIDSTGFTEENNSATNWFVGTTPKAPPTLPSGSTVSGKVILWIEK